MPDFEILAAGLQFPEGPIAMPDGSAILVEIQRQTLTRVWNGKSEVIAQIGGGPNGAALGPDGAIYVTNNGGFTWHQGAVLVPTGTPDDYTTGRVERVDLATGKVERLYENVNGQRLSGPNDIVFDRSGAFWFTDLGKTHARSKEKGGVYYAMPDGSLIKEVMYGSVGGMNGIGLSPDEKTVYAAETETARLWAFDVTGPGEVAPRAPGFLARFVAGMSHHCYFDSLALQANGDVCVATILNGGITTITPAGVSTHTPFPDPLVTNICFGGADMRDAYITLSGTGQLIKTRWPEPGLRLNFAP
jgi:gluconolactonase